MLQLKFTETRVGVDAVTAQVLNKYRAQHFLIERLDQEDNVVLLVSKTSTDSEIVD